MFWNLKQLLCHKNALRRKLAHQWYICQMFILSVKHVGLVQPVLRLAQRKFVLVYATRLLDSKNFFAFRFVVSSMPAA
jgi:hypothetical protein